MNKSVKWSRQNSLIERTIEFNSFTDAIKAINLIAPICEQMNHHPDWSNTYNVLKIKLQTHSEGSVTDLDYALAQKIDLLLAKHFDL